MKVRGVDLKKEIMKEATVLQRAFIAIYVHSIASRTHRAYLRKVLETIIRILWFVIRERVPSFLKQANFASS